MFADQRILKQLFHFLLRVRRRLLLWLLHRLRLHLGLDGPLLRLRRLLRKFDPKLAALIRRFHEAKVARASTVTIWGTGMPRREFPYVDDFADACVFVVKNYSDLEFLNIGMVKT
jgi:hypothetical protein